MILLQVMKRKVLLVGGSGYIGTALRKSNKFEYHVYDLRKEQDATKGIFVNFRPDVVVDLAAFKSVPDGETHPQKYIYNNSMVPLRISRFCVLQNIPIIFISSAAVYGKSVYGYSKSIGEAIYKECPQDATIIRLQNVYGGSGGSSVVDKIKLFKSSGNLFNINGFDYETADGTPARDYIHVDDVVKVINKYIDSPHNCIFDYGTGEETTIKELCVAAGIKYKLNSRRRGDVGNSYAIYRHNPLCVYPENKIKDYLSGK